jgi:hypothetical protein
MDLYAYRYRNLRVYVSIFLSSRLCKTSRPGLADVFYLCTSLDRHRNRVLKIDCEEGLRKVRYAINCMQMEEVYEPTAQLLEQDPETCFEHLPFLRHLEDSHSGVRHGDHEIHHLSAKLLVVCALKEPRRSYKAEKRIGRVMRLHVFPTQSHLKLYPL